MRVSDLLRDLPRELLGKRDVAGLCLACGDARQPRRSNWDAVDEAIDAGRFIRGDVSPTHHICRLCYDSAQSLDEAIDAGIRAADDADWRARAAAKEQETGLITQTEVRKRYGARVLRALGEPDQAPHKRSA